MKKCQPAKQPVSRVSPFCLGAGEIARWRLLAPGAMFEQFLKGGADGGFVLDAEPGELGERIVIGGSSLGPCAWA
jgi:hypothetical protein